MGHPNKSGDVFWEVGTNSGRGGPGGRPRTFQDEDIFRATTRVITQVGYGHLSMEAVARDLGCSAQAIGRRFGSKRGLIRAYVGWAMAGIGERFRESRRTHATALEALRARVLIPAEDRPEEIGDPFDATRRANMLSFWTAMRGDPEFRPLLVNSERVIEAETTALLDEARSTGELGDCDTVVLGRVLIAALTGTTLLWSRDGVAGSLVDRLGQALDAIVDPYRANGAG